MASSSGWLPLLLRCSHTPPLFRQIRRSQSPHAVEPSLPLHVLKSGVSVDGPLVAYSTAALLYTATPCLHWMLLYCLPVGLDMAYLFRSGSSPCWHRELNWKCNQNKVEKNIFKINWTNSKYLNSGLHAVTLPPLVYLGDCLSTVFTPSAGRTTLLTGTTLFNFSTHI